MIAGSAAAQSPRWTAVSAPDGQKFGVGFGNNFAQFYVVCHRGSVSVNLETEGQEGARQSAVIIIDGRPFRLSGVVDPGPEGEWLNAPLANPGPFLDAIGKARSITVQTGSGRAVLTTAGMTPAIQRGVARCR